MTNKEAIKLIQEIEEDGRNITKEHLQALDLAIKALEDRPTGHWVDDKCSVCGKGVEDLIDSREWYGNEEPKFCPFCGVIIEEEEE